MATEPTHRVVGLDPLWPEPAEPPPSVRPRRRVVDVAKLAATNRKITLAKARAIVAASTPPADSSANGQHPKCGRCGGHHDLGHDCFGLGRRALVASAAPTDHNISCGCHSYQQWAERGYRW